MKKIAMMVLAMFVMGDCVSIGNGKSSNKQKFELPTADLNSASGYYMYKDLSGMTIAISTYSLTQPVAHSYHFVGYAPNGGPYILDISTSVSITPLCAEFDAIIERMISEDKTKTLIDGLIELSGIVGLAKEKQNFKLTKISVEVSHSETTALIKAFKDKYCIPVEKKGNKSVGTNGRGV